jgi:hypothetical protein
MPVNYTFEDITRTLQSRTGVLRNSKFEFIEHDGNTTMTMTKAFMNINRHVGIMSDIPDIMPEEHKQNIKFYFLIYGHVPSNFSPPQVGWNAQVQNSGLGVGGIKEMQSIRAQRQAATLMDMINQQETM